MNVVATQSSSSAPVEVSWSPPSDTSPAIIGYRIFYGSGQTVLVPSYVTRIMLNFIESSQVDSVSIRSESAQLPSELISVTVTISSKPIGAAMGYMWVHAPIKMFFYLPSTCSYTYSS